MRGWRTHLDLHTQFKGRAPGCDVRRLVKSALAKGKSALSPSYYLPTGLCLGSFDYRRCFRQTQADVPQSTRTVKGICLGGKGSPNPFINFLLETSYNFSV